MQTWCPRPARSASRGLQEAGHPSTGTRASGKAWGRSSSSWPALHRIADGLEVEVARLDRRHHDGGADVARLRRAHPDRAAHRLEVAEHDDRALIEAEVLHRMADPAVLDQEGAVARETGVEDRARIERPDVPEARDQDAALGGADQVVDGALAALHLDACGQAGSLDVLLLRPVA